MHSASVGITFIEQPLSAGRGGRSTLVGWLYAAAACANNASLAGAAQVVNDHVEFLGQWGRRGRTGAAPPEWRSA